MEYTSINRDLVLEFFLVLSRMEFALKLAGYANGDEKSVSPDWDGFARDISEAFDSETDQQVAVAFNYYLGHPPHKQVLNNGVLDWKLAFPENGSEVAKALLLVRRVRNNLFHGGKYNAQAHEETARNEELLSMGITLLREAMRVSPEVQQAYEGAAI